MNSSAEQEVVQKRKPGITALDEGTPAAAKDFTLRRMLDSPIEPYRSLFALGAVHAFVGAMVWVLYSVQWISNPIRVHPLMMSGGFLLNFATGFLWTAFPRFTQSALARVRDLLPLLACSMGALVAEVLMSERWALMCFLLMMVWTDVFAVQRFRARGQNPPDSFLFVAAALALGTASLLTLVLAQWIELPFVMYVFARIFFLKGLILLLVLGVGFRLLPAFLGMRQAHKIQLVTEVNGQQHFKAQTLLVTTEHVMILLSVVAGFVCESEMLTRIGSVLIGAALWWSGFRVFHIHRMPERKDRFSLMIWFSILALMLTPALVLAFPEQSVHLWHLAFIGGFGLMTIMVSIRVSVSHSGVAQAQEEEKRSYLPWMGACIIVAALTRISVSWWPQTQTSHYVYASMLWITMLAMWFWNVLRYSVVAEKRKWKMF